MNNGETTQKLLNKKEIIIAIIGLIGVFITAFFSNWDKIFPPENVVTSSYSGYQPTGDPQIEFRYFLEITNMRDNLLSQERSMLGHQKEQLRAEYKDNPELLDKICNVIDKELLMFYDQWLNIYIPIASQHFTVQEIQELNKFYSTPIMREMSRRLPLLVRQTFPQLMAVVDEFKKNLSEKIAEISGNNPIDDSWLHDQNNPIDDSWLHFQKKSINIKVDKY